MKILYALALLILSAELMYAQAPVKKEYRDGLQSIDVQTNEGNITIYLAERLHSGDKISGTVTVEPSGKDDKAREKNRSVLNGYVIDFAEEQTVAENPKQTWDLPSPDNTGMIPLVIRDNRGREVARSAIAINSSPRAMPETIRIPSYIIAGEPARIPGSFDGNLLTTTTLVDNQPIEITAQTPGEVFIDIPENVLGTVTIEITEFEREHRETTNVLNTRLSASNTNLTRGESGFVKLEVSGLNGLETMVPVEVSNLSPGIIDLDGGNLQSFRIQPYEIGPEGNWSRDFRVSAKQSGSFSIASRIVPFEYPTDETPVRPVVEVPQQEFALTLDSILQNETFDIVLYNPEISFVYNEFNNDFRGMFSIIDHNLPRKYRFDPSRVTEARTNDQVFNELRKRGKEQVATTANRVDSTENKNRKELRGTVGFRVYYGEKNEYNCYWVYSEWFTWKTEEYYSNQWQTDRKLVDILRSNKIGADVDAKIELKGSLIDDGGISVTPTFSIEIPGIPGPGIDIAYAPPSESKIELKGEMKGKIAGYLDGKSLIIYIFYDEYHVERAYHIYFYRFIQRYCNDSPIGPVLYETTSIEKWEKYSKKEYFTDAYLEVQGITHGSGKIHTRVQTLTENQKVSEYRDGDAIEPGVNQDPADFFDGIVKRN